MRDARAENSLLPIKSTLEPGSRKERCCDQVEDVRDLVPPMLGQIALPESMQNGLDCSRGAGWEVTINGCVELPSPCIHREDLVLYTPY